MTKKNKVKCKQCNKEFKSIDEGKYNTICPDCLPNLYIYFNEQNDVKNYFEDEMSFTEDLRYLNLRRFSTDYYLYAI